MKYKYVIVNTDYGVIAGKIVDYDENSYTLDFNGLIKVAPKEYTWEFDGAIHIEAGDLE